MHEDESLWGQFNLAENNPSPGGGILYCLRYSKEHLEAHHANVVAAFKRMGIKAEGAGEFVHLVPTRDLDDSEMQSAALLAEELSVQNEAIEYHDAGFGDCKSIEDLKNHLVSMVEVCLSRDVQDLPLAYDLVTITVPQIVRDIRTSHRQNSVLSSADMDTIDTLASFAERRARMLNEPKVVMLQS